MANKSNVVELTDSDMIGTERSTFYVVEWKNDNGGAACSVESTLDARDKIIKYLTADESNIVHYAVLAPVGADADEVRAYVTAGNSRLTL